ncbi:kynureninase [Clostridium aciditolerans]|uniref:Kynureninase n=1 Tax=Clostridium aciditolerans TaxID=339861 RepID=A0A934I3G8_9CLOT|nr:kynureninase [Clostridium aciditolerans]MBI6875335.1 kynureninase [Clostridium aciditolerans]
MKYEFKDGLEFAKELDKLDKLHNTRDRFYLNEGEIYMDGNSLGLSSKDAEESLLNIFNVWRTEGIKIWGVEDGRYFNFSKNLAEKLKNLINADANEIIVMGSTTSNIHQGLATFYKPTKERYKIIVDELNFPTDIYAVKSMLNLKGYKIEDALIEIKSRDGRTICEEDIMSKMADDVVLILLPSVLYRSAQLLDMELITSEAHKHGIVVGWDLCHSIGSVPHDFKKIDPDFAVWCSYKYLNAGPGATAGMYINRKHFNKSTGLRGWFGSKDESQFLMSHDFDQDKDANGWLLGTHNMFSMAPLDGVLNIFNEVGMESIRTKSLHITAYLMYLIDNKLSKYGYSIGNPREDHRRGGHVCLEHDEAYRISLALRDNNVIPDYREPNVIRLAPIALYTSYEEVYNLVEILERIVKDKEFENYSLKRVTVL